MAVQGEMGDVVSGERKRFASDVRVIRRIRGRYRTRLEAKEQRGKRRDINQSIGYSPHSLGPWKVRQTVALMDWTRASLLELVTDWPTEIG